MNLCKAPETDREFQSYYQLRWKILRAPWGKAMGSEQDELEEQAFHRMIVGKNGDILAVARMHKTDQFCAQIRYMAVEDKCQGKGYGESLLMALENEARRHGIKTITLKARENAVTFYEKKGYRQLGFSHLLFEEIKHFAMTKALSPLKGHLVKLCQELQQTWHDTIPLSKAMKINIAHYDGNELVTNCDLAFNKNLHNTMFAGSVYTLATLTGWGWVHLQLAEQQQAGDIVLADASIRYHMPLKGVAHAIVEKEDVEGNLLPLSKGKKAKYKMCVKVGCGDKIAATFTGLYVVIPKE